MKILITGSRTWDLMESISGRITEAIIDYGKTYPDLMGKRSIDWVHIVHGGARGADKLADAFARQVLKLPTQNIHVYEADWRTHKRAAGHIRNNLMITKEKPDMGLAFIRDRSPGATGCARLMKTAGVPYEIFRYEDELENYGLAPIT